MATHFTTSNGARRFLSAALRKNAQIFFLFAALIFALPACGGNSPAAGEPDNFRGMKWGTEFSSLAGYERIAGEGDLSFYRKSNESLQIEDVKLDQVIYGSHKGRFYTVMIYFPAQGFSRMKELTAGKLGEPSAPDKTPSKFVWDGSNVTVLLTMAEGSEQARLAYIFKPIQLEIELKK